MRQAAVARIFPLTLLFLLALVIFWLNRATLIDDVPTRLDPTQPQYVLSDIKWQRFDTEGQLADQLFAAEVVQMPKSSLMSLQQVHVKLQQPSGKLEFRAQTAQIDTVEESMTLYDNVVLTQYDQQKQQKLSLYAPKMTLNRQQQTLIAQSKTPSSPSSSRIRAVIYADQAILY